MPGMANVGEKVLVGVGWLGVEVSLDLSFVELDLGIKESDLLL